MKRFNANKALRNDESLYNPLAKVLNYIFYKILYKPIIDIVNSEITAEWSVLVAPEVVEQRKKQRLATLREERKLNREVIPDAMRTNDKKTPLTSAILSGKVQYVKDHFEGSFSSMISREIRNMGGKWDNKRKWWHISSKQLTFDTQIAIGQAATKVKNIQDRINNYLTGLSKLVGEEKPQYNLSKYFEKSITDLNVKFVDGISGIIIAPELTEEMKKNLAKKYNDNMDLYINNWTEESIKRLRKRVQENAFTGYRASTLVKELEHDYEISFSKAKFLARQETSLLMSQFREERYKSAGVDKYRWSTSGDRRVRPSHKRLDGEIFSWDNPPIVDVKTGRRAHPGQDFGCRCIAIPLID